MSRFQAGLSGVTFYSNGCRLIGGFYKAAGDTPRSTAILLHGLPGIEKHLDIAYALRDLGWNCLYFHFRGCWGSHGDYNLAGLADDTRAAIDWVVQQPEVDRQRLALIGASTGSHPAFVCGAADPRVGAVVGISPVVEPSAFQFHEEMAAEFAGMLNGVTSAGLLSQWNALPSLVPELAGCAPRPVLLVAAENDDIFPPSEYADAIAALGNVQLISSPDADHSFSACRPWLVRTVSEWLVNRAPQHAFSD
jgi:alpha/beta superfamily hydrolase